MKSRIRIATLVLVLGTAGWAQLVTSHASTQSQPAPPAAQALSSPIVRVNGSVLTRADLLREEYAIFPYARQHSGQIPPSMEAGIRDGAMKMIVFEELVYQEALRRKMVVPELKLSKAEKEFRGRFSSQEEYKQYLQADCQGSEKVLRDKIRRSLLIEALLNAEVNNKSAVTPAEVRAYYNANPKRFEYPESFLIQTISFMPPQKASPQQLAEARKKADAALPQAKAAKTAEEFGLLAEKISEDDYRVMLGQHKPMDRSQFAPEVLKTLMAMQAGQVTDVLQVGQIYTIVRLNKHIQPGKKKLADVRADLIKELQSNKTNQARAALDKKLRQSAKIESL